MTSRSRHGAGVTKRAPWSTRSAAAALLCLVAGLQATVAQEVSDELRLKAAFVYRFPQFVEWPAGAFEGRSTVELCLLAPSPLKGVLSELAHGEALGRRTLAVRVVGDGQPVDGCHVLFLSRQDAERRAILQQVAKRPVLTVSDAPRFLDEGGIIRLILLDNRLRFEISAAAASRAQLRLSAQLLRLAVAVRGGPP